MPRADICTEFYIIRYCAARPACLSACLSGICLSSCPSRCLPASLPCPAPASALSSTSSACLSPSLPLCLPAMPSASICSDFYIICHGEAAHNVSTLIGGRSPQAALTPLGEQQAVLLGRYLRDYVGVRFHAIFSSPIERSKRTAILACQEMGVAESMIRYADELQELSQGQWERQPRARIYQRGVLEQMVAAQPDFRAPGGESQRQVEFRMVEFPHPQICPPRLLMVTAALQHLLTAALQHLLTAAAAAAAAAIFPAALAVQLMHKEVGQQLMMFSVWLFSPTALQYGALCVAFWVRTLISPTILALTTLQSLFSVTPLGKGGIWSR
ncbi:unnamed protein product [Closterium sp. Naga37s-1]|nr:unnamed protein product [Closterium sp. Naga37s-1]